MRAKVTLPEMNLRRLLDALEEELMDATDEEILDAAKELGMNPRMKGSAAFLGIRYPYAPSMSDFFDLVEVLPKERANRTALPDGSDGSKDPEKH